MNIELEEVVVQDVTDDVLELAAGGAQGGGCTGTQCAGSWMTTTAPIKINSY